MTTTGYTIDTKRALKMRLAGASYKTIGETFNVSKQAAQQHLKPILSLMGDAGQLRAYQDHKADVLEGVQRTLLGDMVDQDKRKKATLGNVAYAVRNLNDMIRLERDQATSNVAVAHLEAIKSVEQADAEIAKITGELGDKDNVAAEYGDDEKIGALEAEIKRLEAQVDGEIGEDGV